LFEKSKTKGMMQGFTDNYIKVEMPENEAELNSIKKIYLKDIGDNLTVNSYGEKLHNFQK